MNDSLALIRQLTCEKCDRPLLELLNSRAICEVCYMEEARARLARTCEKCGRLAPSMLKDRAICGPCYLREQRIEHPLPVETCEKCGRLAPSKLRERIICRSCYEQEARAKHPVETCEKCGRLAPSSKLRESILCQSCYREERARCIKTCEKCGRLAPSKLKDRAICEPCYLRERRVEHPLPVETCEKCGRLARSKLRERIICPSCYEQEARARLARTCEKCGRLAPSMLKDRAICGPCYLREQRIEHPLPVETCEKCGRLAPSKLKKSIICRSCYEQEARAKYPVETCEKCGRLAPSKLKKPIICRSCYEQEERAKRTRTCEKCGRLAPSKLKDRSICYRCFFEEKNGRKLCQGCHQVKVIFFSTPALCERCNINRLGKVSLLRYLESYITPFPYNRKLFALLVDHLDWEKVGSSTYRRLKNIGYFLQQQELPSPLTWEGIDCLLNRLKPLKSDNIRHIRVGLFEIGHRLAVSQLLESRETYLVRRGVSRRIANFPEPLKSYLQRYRSFLIERKLTPVTLRILFGRLVYFWSWCLERDINTPGAVSELVINNYLVFLTNRWKCGKCHNFVELEPHRLAPPTYCENCDSDHALFTRVPCNQYAALMALRGFFKWAKMNRLIASNPVRVPLPKHITTIQHYPGEIIRRLYSYMASPNADPVEAMLLYLILFHAMTPWEIQHAQMPAVAVSLITGKPIPLAEVNYIRVLERPPSRGKYSPGRPLREIRGQPRYV